MNDRISRVLQLLEKEGLDAVLVADRYNVRYFSCFTGDTAYLYISKKQQLLMTDSRYTTWAKSEAIGFDIFQVDRNISYADKVSQLLEEDKVRSIGFENQRMLYSDVLNFQQKTGRPDTRQQQMEHGSSIIPNQTVWRELDNKLDALRQIKDVRELELIAHAEAIGDKAFSHIVRQLAVGMTEQEAAWEIETAMRNAGADGVSFETIAVFGERTAMPHAIPGKRKLQNKELIVMDFGCIYEGYCSDMTRTVCMGKADEQQKKIYETVLDAQQTALSVMKAGLKACDVDKAARRVIADAGYGEYFGHGLGHSVGLFIHESPALSPKDETILVENMVETVEPGIYIPDFGGVRIEDLVVVKKNGCQNLTHSPKKLMEL